MNRAIWMAVAHAFRRTALPLAAYYAVTLVVPLANGGARSGAPFLDHALVVLVIPPVVIMLWCAVHKTSHVVASRLAGASRRARSALVDSASAHST